MWKKLIQEATKCNDSQVEMIEDIMRDDVFKSTLDWQTREELSEAARLAYLLLKRDNSYSFDYPPEMLPE